MQVVGSCVRRQLNHQAPSDRNVGRIPLAARGRPTVADSQALLSFGYLDLGRVVQYCQEYLLFVQAERTVSFSFFSFLVTLWSEVG